MYYTLTVRGLPLDTSLFAKLYFTTSVFNDNFVLMFSLLGYISLKIGKTKYHYGCKICQERTAFHALRYKLCKQFKNNTILLM